VEEHVFDLLPGYALGCLDEQDLLLAARHLARCPVCRKELDGYWETVDHLALAAPPQAPPDHLRARIMHRAAAPAEAPQRAAGPVTGPGWRGWLAAVAAVLLLVSLAASNFLLWQQVNELQASAPGGPARIVLLEGTPDAPQALGYLVIFPNETYGSLVVEDAPPLSPGYAYQLWLVRDGMRANGGVFSVSEDGYGTLEIWAEYPLDSYPSFGITVEPEGGSPGPTGIKVLGGDL